MSHEQVCSRCGGGLKEEEFFYVDEKPVCADCLYPGMTPIRFWPMGIVHSSYVRMDGGPGPWDVTAEIHLVPSMEPFLDRLEDETMIKSRSISEGLKLDMKIGDVEYQLSLIHI